MSFPSRSLPGHMRQPSGAGGSVGSGQSPALVARVNEKKAELENLRELRDLSAAVATQMEALEQRLGTLSDGTEAIALVLANWHNVLQAINMASAKLPKPKSEDEGWSETAETALPQTLVRIPTEHAPTIQAQTGEQPEEEES
ncbi:hypothetical protein GGTG_06793 [Gaeumannomyces tritici R3-111a-1]|uniref:DASH complex subunit DAD2 n=1 Tax=Gaeumannomyces tritici (strain R3-111a-1) TaxID=644352 RepID=J3NZU6_GAET3|nr:hypothetical protein GGTG_06793 [Gaeumannomyces tritici R3-111a-1]EJT76879.1 hypothetical protein GGTG_06793 [Gaeumannomyces tritici R3-111a-1]